MQQPNRLVSLVSCNGRFLQDKHARSEAASTSRFLARRNRLLLRQHIKREGVTWREVRGPISILLENRLRSYARCSHVSRDVQERVVVVLDRGLLVAVVVHFQSRELRRWVPGGLGRPFVPVPAFYRLRQKGQQPVGWMIPPDVARWRPLLEIGAVGRESDRDYREVNRGARKLGGCDCQLTSRSLLSLAKCHCRVRCGTW